MQKLLLTAMTALLLTVGSAWAGPLEDGAAADSRGNYSDAVRWYRQAADQGDPKAQNSLGAMYYNGRGVTQSYDEAVKWYRLAAAQGLADAQIRLGLMYEQG